MKRRYVSDAEAELLDALDESEADLSIFAEALKLAISMNAAHPLTYAASVAEHASFATPIELGDEPKPEPTF